MEGKTLIIGIAGGTSSGKSTITDRIASVYDGKVSVVYHDSYYKAHDGMTYEERSALNYDHPDAFDTELMVSDLRKLRAGETVDCPVYDYTVHNRDREKTRRVEPNPVIIVDGILIFYEKELRDLFDIKIYVDTDADVRILRRLQRDVRDRGRTIDSVIRQYLDTVKPMHERFVEPTKRYADIVIPEGGHNSVALDIVLSKIMRHLQEKTEKCE
ncbi:MAG: uridine kinase [Clostridia bacterium]|nr:uridine kinase [Clostridia bacterium]